MDLNNKNSTNMLSALLYGIKDLRLVKLPIPSVSSNDVLVKIKKCAICPTDVRKYNFENYYPLKFPINPGHEWSGEIVEVGKNIKHIKKGIRVSGEGFIGYAEYGKVTGQEMEFLTILPDEVDYEEGTFLEPMSDCIHGLVNRGKVKLGDVVVIVGAGPMGLQCTSLAKMIGAKVIVCEYLSERRKLALEFGADFVLNPQNNRIQDQIKKINYGKLANVALVTISSSSAINEGIFSVGERGKVVIFGGGPKGTSITIDPNWIHYNEISVIGSEWIGVNNYVNSKIYHIALEIIRSKKIPIKKLISATYPLNLIHKAINAAAKLDTLKIIIEP
jgi:L-iditol 2-dehydrogenase